MGCTLQKFGANPREFDFWLVCATGQNGSISDSVAKARGTTAGRPGSTAVRGYWPGRPGSKSLWLVEVLFLLKLRHSSMRRICSSVSISSGSRNGPFFFSSGVSVSAFPLTLVSRLSSSTVSVRRRLQAQNAYSPMSLTLFGMTIYSILQQPKQKSPMTSSLESGSKKTSRSCLQPSNALSRAA